jgi:hypothetical protein
MLERLLSTRTNAGPQVTPSPQLIYRGRYLAWMARHGTATERAVLAAELPGALVRLTAEQATALAKANRLYAAECRG